MLSEEIKTLKAERDELQFKLFKATNERDAFKDKLDKLSKAKSSNPDDPLNVCLMLAVIERTLRALSGYPNVIIRYDDLNTIMSKMPIVEKSLELVKQEIMNIATHMFNLLREQESSKTEINQLKQERDILRADGVAMNHEYLKYTSNRDSLEKEVKNLKESIYLMAESMLVHKERVKK